MGTPYCITVDNDSLKDKSVTIRERDSTKQVRVRIEELRTVIRRLVMEREKFESAGKPVETRTK